MNSIEEIQYRYTLNLKLSQIVGPVAGVKELVPNAEDISFISEPFNTAEEVVDKSNSMVSELLTSLNIGADKYAMIVETNPNISGQDTMTKNWEPMNLSKVWIVDKVSQNTPGPIMAVGLVDLFQVPGKESLVN